MENRRHPRALPYLFFTEMWERFGFYVVQGMLVLYMTKAFGFSDSDSYTIMGAFSALAYIAPFVGGSLADRLLGFKTSIVFGGILLSAGYAMLAMPWPEGFYFSLATIIVGNGLFKPNISSLLGSLYEQGDPNRESGFTIFYIGINLGVLLAGTSSGYIKDHFGWHAGFALASIGLITGLITFSVGLKKISEFKQEDLKPPISVITKIGIGLCCILAIFLVSILLKSNTLAKWLLPTAGVLLLIYLLIVTFKQEAESRRNMMTLNALVLSSIVFWMIYMQMFFSITLFIDRLIKKEWLGIHVPTTAFYALESIFVILLGPLFAWSWQTLNQSNKNPSSFSKFVLAIAFAGLASIALVTSTYYPDANMMINPIWIVIAYFCITVGEMLLSPIGLSAVTTLAPRKLVGMMMGIWFVALGFGGVFAGWLAKLSDIPENMTSPVAQLLIYRHAFLDFAYIAFAVSALLFAMQLFLRRIFRQNTRS